MKLITHILDNRKHLFLSVTEDEAFKLVSNILEQLNPKAGNGIRPLFATTDLGENLLVAISIQQENENGNV